MSRPASISPSNPSQTCYIVSDEKAFLISDVNSPAVLESTKQTFPATLSVPYNQEIPDYESLREAFKDLQLHFTSMTLIGTFTAGVKFGFLILAQGVTGDTKSLPFQLGTLLCTMAAITDITTVLVATSTAKAASRTATLHLTSDPPPTITEYDQRYDHLRRGRLFCENLQTLGMLLFASAATSISWVMFADCLFAILFNVLLWGFVIVLYFHGFDGVLLPGIIVSENRVRRGSELPQDEV